MRRPILLSGSPRFNRGGSERAGPASPHAEAFSIIQTPHPSRPAQERAPQDEGFGLSRALSAMRMEENKNHTVIALNEFVQPPAAPLMTRRAPGSRTG